MDASDATLVPKLFVVVTVNVYEVPIVNPVNVREVPVVVSLILPGEDVTV